MKINSTSTTNYRLKVVTGLLITPLLIALTACSTAIDYAKLSKSSYEQNRFNEAIDNANLAIEKDPEYSYSWFWLGMSQLKTNQYQDAINSLSKAGQLTSDTDLQKSITYHIGYAYSQIDDCDNAITFYSQAIISGSDWMAHLHRSFCYMKKSQFDEALSDALHVIQNLNSLNDNFKIQAYRVIAFSNLGLGDTKKSLSIINQLQEKFPLYDTWNDFVAIADIADDDEGMATLQQTRGWLGLKLTDYNDNAIQGAKIDSYAYNTPDSDEQIQSGDIVTSLNNTPITNTVTLNNKLKLLKPGETAQIKVLRPKTSAQQPESGETDTKVLELDIAVKSVPASLVQEALKNHPYHAVINEKKSHYKAARDMANSGNYNKAFELYMASSPKHWMDSEILGEVIEVYWKAGKQIEISEQSSKNAFFANKTKSEIKTIYDLNETIDMYKNIIQTTPWWADMHYTLATLYERSQDYRLAATSLKLYLISAVEDDVEVVTGESKFSSIQKKIFDLEYKASTK
jgi:tetratricopeptide (TPR) repeat protein